MENGELDPEEWDDIKDDSNYYVQERYYKDFLKWNDCECLFREISEYEEYLKMLEDLVNASIMYYENAEIMMKMEEHRRPGEFWWIGKRKNPQNNYSVAEGKMTKRKVDKLSKTASVYGSCALVRFDSEKICKAELEHLRLTKQLLR